MKIDKACIDYNIVRLIKGLVLSDVYGLDREILIGTIEYINGLIELGEALKQVIDE